MASIFRENNNKFLLRVFFLTLLTGTVAQPSFAGGGEGIEPSLRSWNSWIKPVLGVAGVGVATFTALTKYVNYKQRYHCHQHNTLRNRYQQDALINRQNLYSLLKVESYHLFNVDFVGKNEEYFDENGFLYYIIRGNNKRHVRHNTPARPELLQAYRQANNKGQLLCIKQFIVEKNIDTLLQDPNTQAACQDFLMQHGNPAENQNDEERKRSVAWQISSGASSAENILNDAHQQFQPTLVQLIAQVDVEQQNNDIQRHRDNAQWYKELQEKPLGMKIGVSALIGVGVVGGAGIANKIISGGIWSTTQPPMSSIWKAQRPIK